MSVTQYLMKPGRWDVRFRDRVAYAAWSQVREMDSIVITANRLVPLSTFSDASVLANAIYSGVIQQVSARGLAGYGNEWWLGTSDGRGYIFDTPVTKSAGTLEQWIPDLLPSAITEGTVTNTGDTFGWTAVMVTSREAIDTVCRAVGAEWRVNPDFTFDAAAPGTLFASYTTPDMVITPVGAAGEGDYQGVDVLDLEASKDAEGYASTVISVAGSGAGETTNVAFSNGANVYTDPQGNNVYICRLVNAAGVPTDQNQAYADAVLAQVGTVNRSVRLSSDTYALPVRVEPGDNLWVYDPLQGLIDTTNKVMWRGELIHPVKVRCKGYTWPILSSMGVYMRRKEGSTVTYVDLTDHVQFEDGQASEWEVGTSRADAAVDAAQLSPAYLGTNSQVAAQSAAGAVKQWVYRIDGNLTVHNGTHRFYLPYYRDFTNYTVTVGLGTAPTGAQASFRVTKNGTGFVTVNVAATTNVSQSSGNVALTDGDYLTVDVTAIGSGTAGADAIVEVLLS